MKCFKELLCCGLVLLIGGCAVAMTSQVKTKGGTEAQRGLGVSSGCTEVRGSTSGPAAKACAGSNH